jgi:CheY-like chemotaxis protein
MLTNWGMRPTPAESGAKALEILQETKLARNRFRLVLTGASLPGMDGFDLAAAIKKQSEYGNIKIIMFSSAGLRGDSARCRELGLSAYLTEPIKQSLLLDMILLALGTSPDSQGKAPLITRQSLSLTRPRLSVLLAEDNIINQKLVTKILENHGHRVTVVNNGEEVLTTLEKEAFDLILMDIQMPKMDGFQATAEIRRRERETRTHLPIVAMTAHAMKGDMEKCLEAGMDAYVAKPVRPLDLLKTIEQVVQK